MRRGGVERAEQAEVSPFVETGAIMSASKSCLSLLSATLTVAGCATNPPTSSPTPAAPAAPPAVTPSTEVYVYPANGQSATQLDRDRYECHLWAVKQTGFDPSQPHLAPHQRVQVVPAPPNGTDTVAGAAAGAVIGAAVAGPYNTGAGAVFGAVTGAAIGAASDASRTQQASRVQQEYDQRDAQAQARIEQQAEDYRRAIGACLDGRGYVTK